MYKLLRNRSIRQRFILLTVAMGVLVLVLIGGSRWTRDDADREFDKALTAQIAATAQVNVLGRGLERMRRLELSMMGNASNALEVDRLKGEWLSDLAKLQQGFKALGSGEAAGSPRALQSARLLDALAAYRKIIEPIGQQLAAATMEANAAFAYAAAAAPQTTAMQSALEELLKQAQASLEETRSAAKAREATVGLLSTACGLVMLLVLGGGMWLTYRSIIAPLNQAKRLAQRVAGGDLSSDPVVKGRDEMSELTHALIAMQAGLRTIVTEVRSSTERIATASSEIASGNQDLSLRTEQTASNLQQTASSMEHLTRTVTHSADAAHNANQLVGSASAVAARGGAVVSQVVATMSEIDDRSKKIADIISTIDGIAFQTNILALNAAVEAARAGEEGRGFAVVAGEVRGLAQRSAAAAKEIKSLIGASVEKVATGTQLVHDAGATMAEIVESVRRVTAVVGEITSTSSEQSAGIGEINASVTQLDAMTQQNSALVEQSAAAAESLKAQAARLAGLVATFRLDARTEPAALTAPA